MKILVMSDSHGCKDYMLEAVVLESPEWILHLGDRVKDCADIEFEYPQIPIRMVRGNCDPGSAELDIDEFTLGGKRFFMTHGHLFGVKTGKGRIVATAVNRGADILLFGHTHIPHYSIAEGFTMINPGSIGIGGKSYAVLDLLDGDVSCELKSL